MFCILSTGLSPYGYQMGGMKCLYIYCWKAYRIDFQKVYVGGSESVTGESYYTLS